MNPQRPNPSKFELFDHGRSWQALEHYPPYTLSIIAGDGPYSTPRTKLNSIEQYTHVEIAILNEDGNIVTPEFLSQFTRDGEPMFNVVADYVSWDDVNLVRKRLELLQEK